VFSINIRKNNPNKLLIENNIGVNNKRTCTINFNKNISINKCHCKNFSSHCQKH